MKITQQTFKVGDLFRGKNGLLWFEGRIINCYSHNIDLIVTSSNSPVMPWFPFNYGSVYVRDWMRITQEEIKKLLNDPQSKLPTEYEFEWFDGQNFVKI
jgi:hypothetical protein